MKTQILTLGFVVLAACGEGQTPTPEPVLETPAPGLPFEAAPQPPRVKCLQSVRGETLNLDEIQQNVLTIVELLAKTGISAEGCAALSDVVLIIRPETHTFTVGNNSSIGGMYVGRTITVARDMQGLGHEALHAFEDWAGVVPATPHLGWDRLQYQDFLTRGPRLMTPL